MENVFVYPCSIGFYDLEKHFSKQDDVVWRKCGDIGKNDIVFIYISKPLREVKYKCVVTDVNVSMDEVQQNSYAIPKGKMASNKEYIKMKLVCEYNHGTYVLDELRNHGMGQFMVPMHASPELSKYLVTVDNAINGGIM